MSIKLETWRRLYSAAITLDQLSPWKHINGYNLFALEVPGKKNLGFCTFKGKEGAYRSLFVYRGLEGLAGFHDLIEYEGEYAVHRFYQQQGLQLVFLDRSVLDKSQLNIIKELGLQFHGKFNWPVFFKYESEKLPRFLETEQDAQYFAQALELANEVSLNMEKYKSELKAKDDLVLTFTRKNNSKTPHWNSKKTDLSRAFDKPPFPDPIFNQIKLELLAQTLPRTGESWIADYMLMPQPVVEKDINDSPIFMRAFLIVNEDSDQIIHTKLYNKKDFRNGISNTFINAIDQVGSFPEALTVINTDTWHYLKPLAERLEIDLFFESEHRLLDSIFSQMRDFNKANSRKKKGNK